MGKCKDLRDGIESLVSGISQIVQKCTIREMPLNLLNFWKVKQIVTRSQNRFTFVPGFRIGAYLLLRLNRSPQGQQMAETASKNRLSGGLGLYGGNRQ